MIPIEIWFMVGSGVVASFAVFIMLYRIESRISDMNLNFSNLVTAYKSFKEENPTIH